MTWQDWVVVAIGLVVVAVVVVRIVRRTKRGSSGGCCGCPSKELCDRSRQSRHECNGGYDHQQ